MDCLATVHVPCGPIQNIAEVFEDPQIKARNMKLELEHPLLGEDTVATLQRVLGKSTDEIRDLQARGVI